MSVLNNYMHVYEAILQIEKEVFCAKNTLVRGESPYVTLSVIRNLAEKAMADWHATNSMQEE